MTTQRNRKLRTGTRVRKANGESGRIAMVFTYRRNGGVKDYVVDTASGQEIWQAARIRVGR